MKKSHQHGNFFYKKSHLSKKRKQTVRFCYEMSLSTEKVY